MSYLKELYSECFKLLKSNTILIQPLIIYTIVVHLLLLPSGNVLNTQSLVVILACFSLTLVLFNSGWFNMLCKSVKTIPNPNLTKEENTLKSLELFNEFFPGVAINFLGFLAGTIINLLILLAVISISYYFNADKLVIPAGFELDKILQSLEKTSSTKQLLSSLPDYWLSYIFFIILINHLLNFLTMFYFQSMVMFNNNPLAGLYDSIKRVFAHPLRTLTIYLSFNIALSFSTLVILLPFCLFQFLGLILYLLSMTYFNLLLFIYLDKQTTNSSSRANCFR